MIASMTGYARLQGEHDWGLLTWEIRSVNHRYLDINFRVPEQFRHLEPTWRSLIAKQVSRGKLDVTLKFQPGRDIPVDYVLNEMLLNKLAGLAEQVGKTFKNSQTNTADILNWPGIIETKEPSIDSLSQTATELLNNTLHKLVDTRTREGEALIEFFEQRITSICQYVKEIESRMPNVVLSAQNQVRERFDAIKLEMDQARMEQELVWLSQKLDVAEELKRLDLHMQELMQIFKKGGVVGRRLDFLMQELNREANTLASKSIDATVTHAAVELKVFIEQMREQVQNIE